MRDPDVDLGRDRAPVDHVVCLFGQLIPENPGSSTVALAKNVSLVDRVEVDRQPVRELLIAQAAKVVLFAQRSWCR